MKTSHVVLAIVAVAAAGGAAWYFSHKSGKAAYYPGAQGFPTNMPGGQPQNAGPGPLGQYSKTNPVAQIIDASTPLAKGFFDSIGSLFQRDVGASEPAADEATGSTQGYLPESWLTASPDLSTDPNFYT